LRYRFLNDVSHISFVLIFSDSMFQPQMDRDQFPNISNLVLVEPNQIGDLIYV